MWKILIVDDNFVTRKLIQEILKDKAVCDAAASVQDAIEAYNLANTESDPYALVLLDVAMPEINGMEFLKYVRDDEQKRGFLLGEGVPIIMVTAYKEHFLKAFDYGCDDYIIKPIDAKNMLKKIEDRIMIRKHRTRPK